MMEIKNDDKSSFEESVLDSGFKVLRIKNDLQEAVKENYPVNQDFIQFHFCLKGQMNFVFNEGNYSFPVNEDHSMLLFNPLKPLPIEVELAPNTWLVSVLISIAKFHSLFSSDADHISFLTPENSTKKYYDNLPFTSSIAVVLSQILQAKVHDSMKSLYFKGKVLDHKMEEARRMLDSQKFNVNEVGLKLGYSTASHFIAAFKKKYGTTPKKYLGSLSS